MTEPTPVIDAWIQHPTPRMLHDPMFASLRRWTGTMGPLDEVPVALTLAALEQGGVSKALTCAWYGPQGPLIRNEEVAEAVQAAPDRLVGVASVDIRNPMNAIRELRRWVQDDGFKALRILPWLWDAPPDDRRYYPLYAACIELDIPFCLQVGHTGPLRPSEPGRPIPYLDRVALEFPELRIVGGHVGFPWTQEMIALAMKYPNVYIDTSAWLPKRYPPELIAYMQRSDCKKVMFGSNFPMLQPGKCLAQVDQLGLSDAGKAAFLGGTAAKVFQL